MSEISSTATGESLFELDSHEYTTACGSNMRMLTPPAKVQIHGDVVPFSSEYDPIKNVPIGTCVTAWDDADGRTWIVVFHQALYFGNKL